MVKIRLRRATAAALQRYPGKKKMEKIPQEAASSSPVRMVFFLLFLNR